MSSAKLFKKMEEEKSPRCTDAIPDNDSAVWGIKHSMPKWSCWDRASQEGRRGKSCTLQHIWCIKSWDLVCKNKLSPPFFWGKLMAQQLYRRHHLSLSIFCNLHQTCPLWHPGTSQSLTLTRQLKVTSIILLMKLLLLTSHMMKE